MLVVAAAVCVAPCTASQHPSANVTVLPDHSAFATSALHSVAPPAYFRYSSAPSALLPGDSALVGETPLPAAPNLTAPKSPDTLRVDGAMEIEQIVVTADRLKDIIPSQRLDGKLLRRLNSHNIADALRYFSGVQIKDYGGIGGLKTVNVRSMGSQHVGVFFDGMQIGNAQNGTVDLGRFSLDNMEAVSLYNGQKSSIFQSAKDFASASAIYMETRRPVFEGMRRNNLKATVKGGSFKTVNPSVLWERMLSERIRGSFDAEYLYTSGEYKFSTYSKTGGYDTTEIRKNGDVRLFRAEAAIFGDVRQGDWKAKVYFYDSERGYPGAVVRETPGLYKHEDRQWDTNFFVQGSLRRRPSSCYSYRISAKYAYDYLHYLSDPRLDVTTMYIENRYRQQEVYLSAANLFTITRWWSADLSVDAQWNRLDADVVDFAYPQRYTLLAAAATSMQFARVCLQGSLLYTHVTDITRRRSEQADAKNVFSPAVILSYRPWLRHDLTFRAFYKEVFRMPTFNDLYYEEIGNKNLEPEYTTQYNLGAGYAREWNGRSSFRLKADLDVYFNRIRNMIVAYPGEGQFRWVMINLGYVEIRGLDAVVQGEWSAGRWSVRGRLGYTYQKAQDFTRQSDPFYGGQIPYIPWHSGSAVAGVEFGGWSLNYSFIYVGERYTGRANIPDKYVPAWYTHDMSLTKDFRLRAAGLRVALEVNNIFNQQYEVIWRYPMPGTNFRIILSLTI